MISVALATYNESSNIDKCLKAVVGWVDEIVVVDGSSTDDTVIRAKKYSAKVISTTNKPNFHINKQMAMDAVKGELVIQLDADEVIDTELKAWIQKLHKQLEKKEFKIAKTEPVAWWVKRRNYFLGRFLSKGGQYPDPVIRVYLNGLARLPQKDVHEQMTVDGEVGWADGHLLHYPYPQFDTYLLKWNRYTSFRATQLADEKVTLNWLNTLRYLIWKPLSTWASLFIRHKGFVDGIPGFTFALFSGLFHALAYLKLWEAKQKA